MNFWKEALQFEESFNPREFLDMLTVNGDTDVLAYSQQSMAEDLSLGEGAPDGSILMKAGRCGAPRGTKHVSLQQG